MKHIWSLAVVSMMAVSSASAQSQAPAQFDARWSSLIGCWVPVESANSARDIRQCVVPTSDGRGVDLLTFADMQQIFADTLVADGAAQPYAQDSCVGERRGHWSTDGDRVLTTSTLRCEGKATVTTQGITTLASNGEWIDVQVASGADEPRVRVRRYVRSGAAWPTPIKDQAAQYQSLTRRMPTEVTAGDVAEAHAAAGPLAVQAWLMETDAKVAIDKRALIGLADGGVAEPVIDLLVARAFPKKFEVHESRRSSGAWMQPDPVVLGGIGRYVDPDALFFAPFGPYYYSGLYRNDYYHYAGYVTVPVTNPEQTPQTGGQVVNGRGYTQVTEREPERAANRGGSGNNGFGGGGGGDASSSGGSSSSSGGVSSSGYSGGGGGFTGGYAVPR